MALQKYTGSEMEWTPHEKDDISARSDHGPDKMSLHHGDDSHSTAWRSREPTPTRYTGTQGDVLLQDLSQPPSLTRSVSTIQSESIASPGLFLRTESPLAEGEEPESRLAFPRLRAGLTATNITLHDGLRPRDSHSLSPMQHWLGDDADYLMYRLSYGGDRVQASEPDDTARSQEQESSHPEQEMPTVIVEARQLLHILQEALTTSPSQESRSEVRQLIMRLLPRAPWRLVTGPAGQNYQQGGHFSGIGLQFTPHASGRGPSNAANGFGLRGNDQNHHEGPNVACASSRGRQTKGVLLRCCFFFGPNAHEIQCPSLWKFPIRLVRHLESHGYFICKKCSQPFSGQDAKLRFSRHKNHHLEAEQRMQNICIAFPCVNAGPSPHPQAPGCPGLFQDLSTERKWFSLFNLVLPGVAPPHWRDVCVTEERDGQTPSAPGDLPPSRDGGRDPSMLPDSGFASMGNSDPGTSGPLGGSPQTPGFDNHDASPPLESSLSHISTDETAHETGSQVADQLLEGTPRLRGVQHSEVGRYADALYALEQIYTARSLLTVEQWVPIAAQQRLEQDLQRQIHEFGLAMVTVVNRFLGPEEQIVVADPSIVPFDAELGVRETIDAVRSGDEVPAVRKGNVDVGDGGNDNRPVAVVGEDD